MARTPNSGAISRYRPIALSNFFFEVITKVVYSKKKKRNQSVDRSLGDLMDRIISPQQTVFIRGPHIHDCIAMVSKVLIFLTGRILEGIQV